MTALHLLNALVLDDGRRWGEVATDWQQEDARSVLEPADGEPLLQWWLRPKGGSKSTDVAAISSVWLVDQAPALSVAYVFSSDLDQSNRLLDRARGLIHRSPGLSSVLEVQARRIVHRGSGARVEALPADAAGSEGILTPLVILEELPNWRETGESKRMLTSALSSIPKWPGARLVAIGHAGDPSHFSFKLLEQARSSARWRVSEIAGPLPWLSSEDIAEQQALLLSSEFARRVLNVWAAGEDRLTTPGELTLCVRLHGPLEWTKGNRYVVGVDLGAKHDRTVAAVVHGEEGENGLTVVLDRMAVWKPSRDAPTDFADVEAWLLEASTAYGRAEVVADPWQAMAMVQRLRRAGVSIEEFPFTAQSVGRLGWTLFELLRDGRLSLPNDPDLLDELAHVRLRETAPGVRRMDHDSSRHDDRAIALALGALRIVERDGTRRGGLRSRGIEDDPMQAALQAMGRYSPPFNRPQLVVKPPAPTRRGMKFRW